MTKDKELIKDFIKHCKKELGIQSLPHIKFIADKDWVMERRSFGEYNVGENTVTVYYLDRNTADVFRSLAHELTHHRQHELKMIHPDSGETGSEIENEAHAFAGIIMRDYGKLNPNIYDTTSRQQTSKGSQLVKEVGEARNPYSWEFEYEDEEGAYYTFETPQNKYVVGFVNLGDGAYDLSFNTAGGVQQGTIRLDTNEGVALRVLATVTNITQDFIKRTTPTEIVVHPIKTKDDSEDDLRRFRVYGIFLKKNLPAGYSLITMGDNYKILKQSIKK